MFNFGLILQFIFVFGLIVFVHELGHFLMSKWLGIEVEEFGFGYPPRLAKLFTWKARRSRSTGSPLAALFALKAKLMTVNRAVCWRHPNGNVS